jgi:hypothetical protein
MRWVEGFPPAHDSRKLMFFLDNIDETIQNFHCSGLQSPNRYDDYGLSNVIWFNNEKKGQLSTFKHHPISINKREGIQLIR